MAIKLFDPLPYFKQKNRDFPLKYTQSLDRAFSRQGRGGILLDLGAGRGPFYEYPGEDLFYRIAYDSDIDALLNNTKLHARICGNAERLPLKKSSVNGVVSRWCLEHVDSVDSVLSELKRVLKANGTLVAIVPNRFYYISFLGRILPQRFYNALWQALRITHVPPSRALYKINTVQKWYAYAKAHDFKIDFIALDNLPSYWYVKIPPLFWLNELLHCVLSLPFFKIFRSCIFVIARFNV